MRCGGRLEGFVPNRAISVWTVVANVQKVKLLEVVSCDCALSPSLSSRIPRWKLHIERAQCNAPIAICICPIDNGFAVEAVRADYLSRKIAVSCSGQQIKRDALWDWSKASRIRQVYIWLVGGMYTDRKTRAVRVKVKVGYSRAQQPVEYIAKYGSLGFDDTWNDTCLEPIQCSGEHGYLILWLLPKYVYTKCSHLGYVVAKAIHRRHHCLFELTPSHKHMSRCID